MRECRGEKAGEDKSGTSRSCAAVVPLKGPANRRRTGPGLACRPLVLPELPALPRARTVLLLVDLINPLQFDGAEELAAPALQAAAAVAALKRDANARGVPTIYVNDNFGHWRSDFRGLVTLCRRLRGPAGTLARLLAPTASDFTVLKPRHSSFHATPLEPLLERMGSTATGDHRSGHRPVRCSSPQWTPSCVASRCGCRRTAPPRKVLPACRPRGGHGTALKCHIAADAQQRLLTDSTPGSPCWHGGCPLFA